MGKIEESLQDLLRETDGNPTADQLATVTGAPKPRKGKDERLDKNVKPRTLEELRGFMKKLSKNLRVLHGTTSSGDFSVIWWVTLTLMRRRLYLV